MAQPVESVTSTRNVHEAKTHLSRLIKRVGQGETVVIARAGKPVAKLSGLTDGPPAAPRRLGFLAGAIAVPGDFDRMGGDALAALFEGGAG